MPLLKHLRGRFARDVGTLSLGATMAHVLALLATPLLSRLFSPDAFGVLALFTALAVILGTVATLRYELPVVLARTTGIAAVLVALCVVIATIVAVLSGMVVLAFGPALAAMGGVPELASLLAFVPLYVLAIGILNALTQWAIRQRRFGTVARTPVLHFGTMILVQLGAGVLAWDATGLVLGFVVGQFMATAVLTITLIRSDWDLLRPQGRFLRLAPSVLKRYRRFPQYGAPQNLVNAVSQHIPHFILTVFFGPATVGLYWLAVRVLNAPGVLVGRAVRQVFYQRLARIHNERGDVLSPIVRVTLVLFAIGGAAFLPVILAGPWLFELVFGEVWRVAGEYARWVSLWSLAGLANIPSGCGIQVLGMQREFLIWEVVLLASRVGTLVLLSLLGEPVYAVAGYACVGAIFNLGLIGYVMRRAARCRTLAASSSGVPSP